MSRPKKLYTSSSEEEDDDDNYIPSAKFTAQSAVHRQPPISSAPIIELRDEHLDVSRSEGEEEDDGCSHLKPKLKVNKSPVRPNSSNVYTKAVSQSTVFKKEIANAYTFKLKSPPTNIKKKKHDPVALFQKTSTAWKKDKFLTSRGNAKEGRKLDLDRRNKDIKTIA